MEEITYYFQHKKPKKIEKILTNPLFETLVAYFLEHQEDEIILRKLKNFFSEEKHFEQFLEELVSSELIRRHERRYYLNFPIVTSSSIHSNYDHLAENLVEKMAAYTTAEQAYFYGEQLWETLFANEKDYFFGVIHSAEAFYKKEKAGSEQLQFLSVHPTDSYPLDLAAYFTVMDTTSGAKLPEVYQPLHQLIGDVDSHYFATQTYRVIRTVVKKRRMTDKRNIFLEALVLIGDLVCLEGEWFLKIPIITEKETTLSINILNELPEFHQIADTNERVYSKLLFYQMCMVQFLKNQEFLSYFIYS